MLVGMGVVAVTTLWLTTKPSNKLTTKQNVKGALTNQRLRWRLEHAPNIFDSCSRKDAEEVNYFFVVVK